MLFCSFCHKTKPVKEIKDLRNNLVALFFRHFLLLSGYPR